MNSVDVQEASRERAASPSQLSRVAAKLLDRAIFGALLALIVLVAIPYGTVEPWWEAVFECAIFGLGALWLIDGLFRGIWHLPAPSMLVPLLALAAYAFLQTLPVWHASTGAAGIEGDAWRALSADPYGTRRFVDKLLALILAGALFHRYTSSQRRLRALIYVIIGVGVASALFGIVRQATQRSPGYILPLLGYDYREYAQFISRNHFAFLMEMVFGLVLGLLVGRGVRRERVLIYLALLLPVWTALVLANSRGGILSMFGQLIFTALLFTGTRTFMESFSQRSDTRGRLWRFMGSLTARVLLVACLVVAVAVGMVWMGGDPLVSRLETVSGEVRTASDGSREGARRAEMWRATWNLIKANPITGVGFGAYWTAIPEYHDASGKSVPQEAHNDYLELVASGGLIGAALAAWWVGAFVRRARQTLRSTTGFRRAAGIGALIGISGVAIHSLVDFGLHITINALIFVALVVIATHQGMRDEGGGMKKKEG